MPCHSLVAMTLQCPCNDTGLKTGCPSQRMSKCSKGARRRLEIESEVSRPSTPFAAGRLGHCTCLGGEGPSSQLCSRKRPPCCSFRNYQRVAKGTLVSISLCKGLERCRSSTSLPRVDPCPSKKVERRWNSYLLSLLGVLGTMCLWFIPAGAENTVYQSELLQLCVTENSSN